MADDQTALPQSIRSALGDSKPDKRKQAAGELESEIKRICNNILHSFDSGSRGSTRARDQMISYIRCLVDEFCTSAFPNRRKGGLLGLATVAITLEHKAVQPYTSQLVLPVLTCLSDEDAAVRYSACEACYNIAKVVRSGIITHNHMAEVFDGLCRLYVDVDRDVKKGATCLDRLVQDIVTEYRDFDYAAFIPILTTRINVPNPSLRSLVLGWILLLDSVPQVDMIEYLPQYLEGLFHICGGEPRDLRHNTETFLADLLKEIQNSISERPERAQRAIANAAGTVAQCCRTGERRAEDNMVRLKSLYWLKEFLRLQVEFEDQDGKTQSDSGLRKLVPVLLSGVLYCLDDDEFEISTTAGHANAELQVAARRNLESNIPVEAITDAVLGAMHDTVAGKERKSQVMQMCFAWVKLMLTHSRDQVLQPSVRHRLLDSAFQALQRPEEEVVVDALWLISQLVASSDDMQEQMVLGQASSLESPADFIIIHPEDDDLFARFCYRILTSMAENSAMLKSRGEIIVQKLCDGLNPERFFATVAKKLEKEEDVPLAGRLVRVLNRVLFTSRETRAFRKRLQEDAVASARPGEATSGTQEVPQLLMQLLLSWYHCPVCTVTLCLWLHWFDLAAEITARLVEEVEGLRMAGSVSKAVEQGQELQGQELQEQLDQFVELLESPIFIRFRFLLLESPRKPSMLHTVLGLAALLPKPKEQALCPRLDVVEAGLLLDRFRPDSEQRNRLASVPEAAEKTLASRLLHRFDAVVDAHRWKDCVT